MVLLSTTPAYYGDQIHPNQGELNSGFPTTTKMVSPVITTERNALDLGRVGQPNTALIWSANFIDFAASD